MINYNNIVKVVRDYIKKKQLYEYNEISDLSIISTFKYLLFIYKEEFVQSEENILLILKELDKTIYAI